MTLPLIKASMRSAEIGHLADQIALLEAGGIDGLHFDVMDGRFGPEISMGPFFLRGLRKYTTLPFDVHLWVDDPGGCVADYVDAGADCVTIHIESCADPAPILSDIRARGCQAGLAINPGTPVVSVEPLLALCDQLNVMAIAPGKPGKLDDEGVANLRAAAALAAGGTHTPAIQVDGAVSSETRELFVAAGAGSLVAGYPVFSRPDFKAAIDELRHGNQLVDRGVLDAGK